METLHHNVKLQCGMRIPPLWRWSQWRSVDRFITLEKEFEELNFSELATSSGGSCYKSEVGGHSRREHRQSSIESMAKFLEQGAGRSKAWIVLCKFFLFSFLLCCWIAFLYEKTKVIYLCCSQHRQRQITRKILHNYELNLFRANANAFSCWIAENLFARGFLGYFRS